MREPAEIDSQQGSWTRCVLGAHHGHGSDQTRTIKVPAMAAVAPRAVDTCHEPPAALFAAAITPVLLKGMVDVELSVMVDSVPLAFETTVITAVGTGAAT